MGAPPLPALVRASGTCQLCACVAMVSAGSRACRAGSSTDLPFSAPQFNHSTIRVLPMRTLRRCAPAIAAFPSSPSFRAVSDFSSHDVRQALNNTHTPTSTPPVLRQTRDHTHYYTFRTLRIYRTPAHRTTALPAPYTHTHTAPHTLPAHAHARTAHTHTHTHHRSPGHTAHHCCHTLPPTYRSLDSISRTEQHRIQHMVVDILALAERRGSTNAFLALRHTTAVWQRTRRAP